MSSLRISSVVCVVLAALACNPSVTEATSDDEVAEASGSESEVGSESAGSTSSTSSSESSTDTNATTSDDPCPLGTLGCGCDAGTCELGLACVGGVCIEDAGTSTDTTDTTTDTGVELHNCGWVVGKDYYFCGGEGVDPSNQNPFDCSAFDFPMIGGAPCGPELNYVGCCDAMGDAWYCLEGLIKYEVCGAL